MLIVFDLDGTLIDSSEDLAVSMNATRAYAGLEPLDPSLIYSYVGNGAPVLVRRALGTAASEALVEDALKFFLQFYRKHALQHTRLYPGIREVVEELLADGNKLAVLTNKPVRISRDIIAALGLGDHFVQIYGGDSFPTKKPDPTGMHALLADTATMHDDSLLVGDSGVDVQTARNARVRSCGVLWGFQPEAFELNAPDILVSTPAELLAVARMR